MAAGVRIPMDAAVYFIRRSSPEVKPPSVNGIALANLRTSQKNSLMAIKLQLALGLIAALAGGCHDSYTKTFSLFAGRKLPTMPKPPEQWMDPAAIPCVPNMFKVSDDLYIGDEPASCGWQKLRSMGIRTVINLRSLHSTRCHAQSAGLKYVHIRFVVWEPKRQDVLAFVKVMSDAQNRPVFIHCYTGADRAGLMAAVYRMVFCGWSRDHARQEMLYSGAGFHQMVVKWLVPFFDDLDVEDLKRSAGVTDQSITPADRSARPPDGPPPQIPG